MPTLSRRELLASAPALVAPGLVRADEPKKSDALAFYVVGDTHYFADKDNVAKLDPRSAGTCGRLLDVLNALPGTDIPKEAGGGKVLAPHGLLHAGDCIDTGDKANVKMQETEWAGFADGFGLTGKDGKLKCPVYEVHGNHDSPRGDGLAVKKIVERNKNRPHVKSVSKNGLHYAWQFGGVHFIALGIVVGEVKTVARKRRYAPLDSLEFLLSEQERVGKSGIPVVLLHHVDMLRYAAPVDDDKVAMGKEWDPADVKGYHEALKGFNVAAIFYGHTHARNVYRWAGGSKPAEKGGVAAFNVDNGSHYNSQQQAFFYVEIEGFQVKVREYQTTDAWATGKWTPQVWTAPFGGG
jgi:predicted phosphodiesterase